MKRWVFFSVLVILAVGCTGSDSVVIRASTKTAVPKFSPTAGWITYQDSTFGLSFQYPPSMGLLLDEPDASGIQLGNESLTLNLILNPLPSNTVEEYAFQQGDTGFTEKRRTPIDKGSWRGVRLEGTAKDRMFGYEYEEVVYLVETKDSLLTLIALWIKSPPDYHLVDTLWNSLQLRFDSFVLSPALSTSGSMTTFSSPDGRFSFRYPTSWQARVSSDSLVNIMNPEDPDALLLSATKRDRKGESLVDAAEQELRSISASFRPITNETQLPASVIGAVGPTRLSGSLSFKDGAAGKFRTIVAISANHIYVISVIYESSQAGDLLPIDEIFRSLTIN